MTQPGLLVARIGKPHGLRGEVTVQLHTDVPRERLRVGAALHTDSREPEALMIDSVRVHRGRYLLGFHGVRDRPGAERLRNIKLFVSSGRSGTADTEGGSRFAESGAEVAASDAADRSPDSGYYEDELLGMQVLLLSGDVIGTVAALHTRPAQDLLEISREKGAPVLVPFVAALVPHVDTDRRRIVIDPPAGLVDVGD